MEVLPGLTLALMKSYFDLLYGYKNILPLRVEELQIFIHNKQKRDFA